MFYSCAIFFLFYVNSNKNENLEILLVPPWHSEGHCVNSCAFPLWDVQHICTWDSYILLHWNLLWCCVSGGSIMGVVFEPRLSCSLGKRFFPGLYPTLSFFLLYLCHMTSLSYPVWYGQTLQLVRPLTPALASWVPGIPVFLTVLYYHSCHSYSSSL